MQTSYAYDSFKLGPLIVDATKLYAGAAAIVVAAALFAFFQYTRLGTAIRACADNYTGALVVGLDVEHLYALTFGLGAACVGAAGVMLVLIVDVTPALGPAYTLLAFVIVITGGLGSMPGALLGGVLIGLTEAMAGLLFTPRPRACSPSASWCWCCCSARRASWAKEHHEEGGMIARLIAGVPRRALLMLVALLIALIAAPLFAGDYLLTVLILILYFAYLGQSWNIMMGFAGQLSLGHALYVGLGAYTAAALYVHFGIGPWIGLLAAVPIAALAGAFIGFLAFRFRVAGVYFAILTIAVAEFARVGFDHVSLDQRRRPDCSCRSRNMPATISGTCAAIRRCSITSCWPRPCSP